MVNSISAVNSAYIASVAQQTAPKSVQEQKQSSPQDTVTISAAARQAAASTDVDHDGDSK